MKLPLPGRLGLFRRAINHVKLAGRLLREPQVSIGWKALLVVFTVIGTLLTFLRRRR